jgi:hypothetical protein
MRDTRLRRDDGLTMVLVALLLVVLMFFAAIVIDVGATYNHRRQDQSAADASALAAAQSLGVSEATLVAQAKQYAHNSLDTAFTSAEWNSCSSDTGALTIKATGSNCISYNASQVRVRLPDSYYETTFGKVVGIEEIRHSAFAIAGQQPVGFGGVLPFAVTGSSGDGGFGCLKSNSNGGAQPWCGTTSGNFGFLDFSHFGDTQYGTTISCGSGATSARIRNNIAVGVDHMLSKVGSVHGTSVVDTDACSATPQTQRPDAARTQTGNNESDVTAGIFDNGASAFTDGLGPRLRRSHPFLFNGAGQTVTVHTVPNVDNNPLWRFIPANYGPGEATSADIPSSCKRDQFVDGSGSYYSPITSNSDLPAAIRTFLNPLNQRDQILGLLSRCFTHYQDDSWSGFPVGSLVPSEAPLGCTSSCSDPVFALDSTSGDEPNLPDIQYTPRFGYVPQISGFPSGQSDPVEFQRFRAVFIHRLFIERSGTDTIFDPGVTPTAPTTGSYQRVGEVSVFVFPDGMLPNGLADEQAPFEIGKNRFIRLLR